MFDEFQRVRECDALVRSLAHYAEAGKEDRTVWHDRLMALDGVEATALVRLHGELLGHEWLEVNLGCLESNCYRITHGGLRILRQAQAGGEVEEESRQPVEPDQPPIAGKVNQRSWQSRRKKRASGEAELPSAA